MSPRIAACKRFEEMLVVVSLFVSQRQNNSIMTTSTLYHTQGTYGFQYKKTERKGQTEYYHVFGTTCQLNCPCCGSKQTTVHPTNEIRQVRGVPIGLKKTIICVQVRRIRCLDCGSFARERIDFCPDTNVSYTKWLAKYVLALRAHMSISAVAEFTGLHWDTVKTIEKRYLARKYAKVPFRDVRRLGIDEVYLGRKFGFITVVRNLESGAVLFVGKGKGGDALKPLKGRLLRRAKQIEVVAIDMSNAYAAWLKEVLPDTDIVYDHFHVIKLMNERMDTLRRSTMNVMLNANRGKRALLFLSKLS